MAGEADYFTLHEIVQKWKDENRSYEWIEVKLMEAGLSKSEVYELYYGVAFDEKANWFYYFVLGLLFSAAVELVFTALGLPYWISIAYSGVVLVMTVFFYTNAFFKKSKRVPMLTGMAVVAWVALLARLSIEFLLK
ncbi:hypothetical protein HUU53_01225 [Candidatus Micrarchaeota archaeon]|nr:hypothetical protein [Candidatus Micrarchaeota archaeon]